MLKLMGFGGRTFRCLWMLEEAGVAYQHEHVDFSAGETRDTAFLAINPNGKVPVLVDGDLVLVESLAINCHIARHYAPQFWPVDLAMESAAISWLAWAMGELEGPHDAANKAGSKIDGTSLDRSLNALRLALADRPYLTGDRFTVADLNTICVLLRPQYRPIVRRDDSLKDWFGRCANRDALIAAVAKNGG